MNHSEGRAASSWKNAFLQTPGPRTRAEAAILYLKGVCMGSADIVPGVSGGTIALITGIYGDLLDAIKSIDLKAARALARLDVTAFLAEVHLRFLIVLLAGIGTALVSLARLMNYLLEQQPVPTWGFFLGLVGASILIIGRKIEHWPGSGGLFFLGGTVAAYLLVGLIPVTTPEAPWFIVLSGMIAICAMILPGISGSFLLLIFGKYQFITAALRNPVDPHNLGILALFTSGCVVGILGFSRLLSFLLHRFHNPTMALLTGLMCGSLRKVWPWKEVLQTVTVRGKVHVLRDANVLPAAVDTTLLLTVLLALAGFGLVLLLERTAADRA
ncbi:MAG: DUF368 domain-containing protein [Thermodesulfobacteriota bacterium]